MLRIAFLIAAIAGTTVSASSAPPAAVPGEFSFRLEQGERSDRVRADFRRLDRPNSQWNSTFRIADLAGLDRAQFGGAANGPVRFAIVRDAGRLDCSGYGASGTATGRCGFSADRGFRDFLRSVGIAPPTPEQSYTMTAVGVRRGIVSAIVSAGYPRPSLDDLISLAALGVDQEYIRQLDAAGYRPASIDTLVQFKALGITPDYIAGLNRLGLGRLPASTLIQFKALGIDEAYVAGLGRAGYRDLPTSTLVEFRALNVTPAFIEQLRLRGFRDLPPGRIVQMKALGIIPDEAAGRRANRR